MVVVSMLLLGTTAGSLRHIVRVVRLHCGVVKVWLRLLLVQVAWDFWQITTAFTVVSYLFARVLHAADLSLARLSDRGQVLLQGLDCEGPGQFFISNLCVCDNFAFLALFNLIGSRLLTI